MMAVKAFLESVVCGRIMKISRAYDGRRAEPARFLKAYLALASYYLGGAELEMNYVLYDFSYPIRSASDGLYYILNEI